MRHDHPKIEEALRKMAVDFSAGNIRIEALPEALRWLAAEAEIAAAIRALPTEPSR